MNVYTGGAWKLNLSMSSFPDHPAEEDIFLLYFGNNYGEWRNVLNLEVCIYFGASIIALYIGMESVQC